MDLPIRLTELSQCQLDAAVEAGKDVKRWETSAGLVTAASRPSLRLRCIPKRQYTLTLGFLKLQLNTHNFSIHTVWQQYMICTIFHFIGKYRS